MFCFHNIYLICDYYSTQVSFNVFFVVYAVFSFYVGKNYSSAQFKKIVLLDTILNY